MIIDLLTWSTSFDITLGENWHILQIYAWWWRFQNFNSSDKTRWYLFWFSTNDQTKLWAQAFEFFSRNLWYFWKSLQFFENLILKIDGKKYAAPQSLKSFVIFKLCTIPHEYKQLFSRSHAFFCEYYGSVISNQKVA